MFHKLINPVEQSKGDLALELNCLGFKIPAPVILSSILEDFFISIVCAYMLPLNVSTLCAYNARRDQKRVSDAPKLEV